MQKRHQETNEICEQIGTLLLSIIYGFIILTKASSKTRSQYYIIVLSIISTILHPNLNKDAVKSRENSMSNFITYSHLKAPVHVRDPFLGLTILLLFSLYVKEMEKWKNEKHAYPTSFTTQLFEGQAKEISICTHWPT